MDPLLHSSTSETGCVEVSEKIIECVTCTWKVTHDSSEYFLVKSPTFFHSESTNWSMELSAESHEMMLYFRILSSQRDLSVQAQLKTSVTWEGAAEIEEGERTVTLNEAQEDRVCLLLFDRPMEEPGTHPIVFFIHGEVGIPAETPEPHRIPALHKDLHILSDNLGMLLDSGDLSDFVLCAGSREFKVHSHLLYARSPVFAAMLHHDTQEARTRRVNIEDIEPDELRQFLCYIYTGRTPYMEGMADQLLVAADKYGLERLKELCEHKLALTLTVDNAAKTGVTAWKHSCGVLKKAVMMFIRRHFASVMRSDGWAAIIRQNADVAIEISRLIGDNNVE